MEWRKSLACALALAGMMAFGPGVRQAALAADTHNLTILGGGSGGLWAIISEGVGETLRRSMPNVRVTTEPGKDGPNQVMTSRGEVQFALATDVLTLKAIKGEAPFKGRKLDNLRLVAVMNPINALQFFVDAKTGAKSIQDIKDKKIPLRITVNRQGTLIDVATEELLKTYGITYSRHRQVGRQGPQDPRTRSDRPLGRRADGRHRRSFPVPHQPLLRTGPEA